MPSAPASAPLDETRRPADPRCDRQRELTHLIIQAFSRLKRAEAHDAAARCKQSGTAAIVEAGSSTTPTPRPPMPAS
jgi:hypothetical protein